MRADADIADDIWQAKILRVAHVGLLITCAIAQTSDVHGQVFNKGPSESSLFTKVIDVPPHPSVQGLSDIGGVVGETTQLNIRSGGVVGGGVDVHSGVEVNISGGVVSNGFRAWSGSEVNVSGGVLGINFVAFPGSDVTISGGAIGQNFRANAGSAVRLVGGGFQLNGEDYYESQITLANGDVFSGAFADGSAFIFSRLECCDTLFFDDTLVSVALAQTPLPTYDLTPLFIDRPVASGPSGLMRGQSLTLLPGGTLGGNYAMVGAALNVYGGSVGDGLEVLDSQIDIREGIVGRNFTAMAGSKVYISGGRVGDSAAANTDSEILVSGGEVGGFFSANYGSVVTITDGVIGDYFSAGQNSKIHVIGGSVGRIMQALSGSEVYISGGSVGAAFDAFGYSVVNISGGVLGDGFQAFSNSEVNIRGGSIGAFLAEPLSEVNLFGYQWMINSVPLESLKLGDSLTITERDVTISGVLVDGTPFSFDLNSTFTEGSYFSPRARLTVTLIPEPANQALLCLILTMCCCIRR